MIFVKVGIQFYSVKDRLAADSESTLRAVAEIGYKNWETCAIKGVPYDPQDARSFGFGVTAPEAKALMKELGVTAVGGHFSRNLVNRREELLHYLDYQAEVGLQAIGLAFGEITDLDSCKRNATHYNWIGEECRKRGIQFYYHNHNYEFRMIDGKWALEWILDNCDPDLVRLELDTFWVLRSGNDPAAVIDHFGSRILFLHQKDLAQEAAGRVVLGSGDITSGGARALPEDFTEVGTGIMDIQSIIDHGNRQGVAYIILEQDHSKLDELESIRVSMDAFSRFRGIELT